MKKKEVADWREIHLKIWEGVGNILTNTVKNCVDFKVYYDIKRLVEQDVRTLLYNLKNRGFNHIYKELEGIHLESNVEDGNDTMRDEYDFKDGIRGPVLDSIKKLKERKEKKND
jgi:hypothetical protein